MGNDCYAMLDVRSRLDALFDELPVSLLNPGEVVKLLNEIKQKDYQKEILVTDFLNFCMIHCTPGQHKDEFYSFWIRFYNILPDKYRESCVFLTFALLSKPSDKKIFHLVDAISPLLNKETGSISRHRLKLLVSGLYLGFSYCSLADFPDLHEGDEHYEFERDVAFTTGNVEKYIEDQLFNGQYESQINVYDFFKANIDKLQSPSTFRQNIRDFGKNERKKKEDGVEDLDEMRYTR